jgi:hypothetical protein
VVATTPHDRQGRGGGAEGKKPKDNSRFAITNMKQSPQFFYEKLYGQRGEIENRIKELHDLQSMWPDPKRKTS